MDMECKHPADTAEPPVPRAAASPAGMCTFRSANVVQAFAHGKDEDQPPVDFVSAVAL
ncbi:hypothetical protein AK812_SmicGene46352, partial [Symbiodinium microadriaticum]